MAPTACKREFIVEISLFFFGFCRFLVVDFVVCYSLLKFYKLCVSVNNCNANDCEYLFKKYTVMQCVKLLLLNVKRYSLTH